MAERRERILDAARTIIGERGYAALTMRDLARESRVTVPTIYNLIGSKDEVLLAAVEEQIQRFLAGLDSAGEAAPAQRAVAVVEACVRELLRWPRYYRALLMLLFGSATAAPVHGEVDGTLRTAFGSAVSALAESHELANWVDPEALADQLRLQLQATSLQWAGGGLADHQLGPVALYGAALALAAAARGESRRAFEACAAEVQASVGSAKPRRRSSRYKRRGSAHRS